jgi:adenylate kinase
MKRINSKCLIFFGAPGVGKGTYGKIFAKKNKFQKISPGDELRNLISNDSIQNPKIASIKALLKQGKLVDDNSILSIIPNKITNKIL